MHQGPWLFRDQALIIEEYDGFTNPLSIKMDRVTVWAQIHKLPDNYLKECDKRNGKRSRRSDRSADKVNG
jgi:hypothetical protein